MIKNRSIHAACAIPLAVAMTGIAPQIATAAVHAEQSPTAARGTGDIVRPPTEEPGSHNPWG